VLLASEHEPADRHLLEVGHGVEQEPVGLGGAPVRRQVVGALEEDRVDLLQVDEVLDLDHPGGLGSEGVHLLLVHHHVLTGRDLVALDDLLVGDLLAGDLRDLAVADPGTRARLELVESHVLGPGGRHQLDRHGHQPERDGSAPDGAWHVSPPLLGSLLVSPLVRLPCGTRLIGPVPMPIS
jgi:hypothetical protein